jgi:hypothetical protein
VKLPEALSYCIDISHNQKVLSLEWADDGRTRVISFKRGSWEAELLALSPDAAGWGTVAVQRAPSVRLIIVFMESGAILRCSCT